MFRFFATFVLLCSVLTLGAQTQETALVLVSFSPLRGKLVLKDKTAHRFTFLSKGTLFTAVRIKSINSNQ